VVAVGSHQTRVVLGPLNLSAHLRQAGFNYAADVHEVTTLQVTGNAKVFIPTLTTSTWAFDGPLDVDPTANLPYDILTDNWREAELAITFAPAGLSTGSIVFVASSIQTEFSAMSDNSGGTDWSASGQTNGSFDCGVSVEDFTAVTIDGNGTARDGGAATANGGIAQLHVSAFSGLTNNVVTIEHSVDGSTSWTTLVTFATYTGLTSERVVVAAGTTVRRYLRVVDNVTGTGSTTRQVSFCRR
jgi:hypothetical protein